MRKLLLLFTLIFGSSTACDALAQFRTLPTNAKRTTVGAQKATFPYVNLGGKTLRLAPGGVIYDTNNRSIIHPFLPPGADVVFTTDLNGDVARIYVLTPAEQTQLNQRRR